MLSKSLFLSLLLLRSIHLFGQVEFEDQSIAARINNPGSNHGVSFGDFNNDGLDDIYFAVREEGFINRLYKNKGEGFFEEVGFLAGVSATASTTAAVWGDINNDGLLDLYIGNQDVPNQLFLNLGNETFEDITESARVGDTADPRSVNFVDIDNDGYLDIYLHNFQSENVFYLNNQDNTFRDATMELGALNIDQAMGTIFFDMDNDGDQDLYAVNDGGINVMYENVGGVFEDISEQSGLATQCFCMGVDFGDYNHDGFFDIYISNFGDNFFYENNGDGTFTDRSEEFQLNDPGLGWGTFWFDYDNDGFQDIYLANNFFISSRPNILFRNNEGQTFDNISEGSNIESPYNSFGSAMADVNNDGLLDIAVANWGQFSGNELFINRQTENKAIQVKAIGTLSNYSAIGTTVTIRTDDLIQKDQVAAASGYASQNSLTLHFGVGDAEIIDEMIIKWPSGIEEVYSDLAINTQFTVTEEEGITSRQFSNATVLNADLKATVNTQSFPNPFTANTWIPVDAAVGTEVYLEILSLEGKSIKVLKNGAIDADDKAIEWDGRNANGDLVEPGIYFYKLTYQNKADVITGKMFLIR